MKKKNKIIVTSILMLSLLLSGVNAAIAAQSVGGSKNTLYVEGGKIAKTEGQPVTRTDTVFVPIAPVVKGMGDKLAWIDEPNSALVTKKDGTKINIYVGKYSAIVNGKAVPISTKVINTVTVPVPMKPASVSGKLYVPIEFLKEVLGYSVEVQMEGKTEYVIVGKAPAGGLEPIEDTSASTPTPEPTLEWKPDLGYLPPAGWKPPQIKSVATDDFQENRKILEDELGFQRGIWYNPYGKDAYEGLGRVRVGLVDGAIANIDFLAWYGDKGQEHASNTIPYVTQELFRFYLPKEYNKLFKIMDDGYNGKDISKYIDKPFMLDGRKITITENQKSVTVKISKK